MKRFALIVGALSASMAVGAQAADETEFKNAAEVRVRYENDMNRTSQEASNQQANTAARFKWNVSARKGEKLQGFLSLIHNTTFGAGRNDATGSTGTNADYTSVGTENALVVSRAWGWWKASDSMSMKVGRFGVEIADGAVFSEDDYFAFPISHEGLNLAFDTSFAKLDVYAVKAAELTPAAGANTDPETNVYILSADVKNLPEAIKIGNVHVVQTNKDSLGGATGSANWQHIGFTVGGDAMNILYKATAAFQMGSFNKPDAGTEQKISANMFDLMVGYQMPETMGLKLTAGYHMDSGDSDAADDKEETYQTMAYDSHNYAGLMDLVKWGNLSYFNINASMMPMEDLEAGVGFYMFTLTKDTAGGSFGSGYNGGTAPTLKAKEKNLGNEIDLFVNKSYGSDMKIGARYGMFMPGTAIKEGIVPNADKTQMDFVVQASMAF